jgi:hypothetical protein
MTSRRWTWVGDSITVGMADALVQAYAARGDEGVIHAESGWTIGRWLNEGAVDRIVSEEQPSVVVVALGTNNEDASRVQFIRLVKDLVAKAGKTGARVVWIGPFNSQERNEWGKAEVADWVDGMKLAQGLARSGIHFVAESYKQLAARAIAEVDKVLLPKPTRRSPLLPMVAGMLISSSILVGLWWWKAKDK